MYDGPPPSTLLEIFPQHANKNTTTTTLSVGVKCALGKATNFSLVFTSLVRASGKARERYNAVLRAQASCTHRAGTIFESMRRGEWYLPS